MHIKFNYVTMQLSQSTSTTEACLATGCLDSADSSDNLDLFNSPVCDCYMKKIRQNSG